jgi:hypothetical protein
MLVLGTDWATYSSLATAGGTLVLAIATFAAVRSSNRSARVAEVALREQRRPIFSQSRLDDPIQKIMFVEGHWVRAAGGHGVAEHDGAIYLAISLRNVGTGIGVCQAWHVAPGQQTNREARDHAPDDQFRLQTRDLYIPAGDVGMWQGALRDRNDATFQGVAEAIDRQDVVTVELLYSDQVGDQRTITRFGLVPFEVRDNDGQSRIDWFATINRHWYLDRAGPRSDEQISAAVDVVLNEREAAQEFEAAEAAEAATEAEGAATEAETAPAAMQVEAAEAEAAEAGEAASDAQPADAQAARADGALSAETDGAEHSRSDEAESQRADGAGPVAVIPRPNCE